MGLSSRFGRVWDLLLLLLWEVGSEVEGRSEVLGVVGREIKMREGL